MLTVEHYTRIVVTWVPRESNPDFMGKSQEYLPLYEKPILFSVNDCLVVPIGFEPMTLRFSVARSSRPELQNLGANGRNLTFVL